MGRAGAVLFEAYRDIQHIKKMGDEFPLDCSISRFVQIYPRMP